MLGLKPQGRLNTAQQSERQQECHLTPGILAPRVRTRARSTSWASSWLYLSRMGRTAGGGERDAVHNQRPLKKNAAFQARNASPKHTFVPERHSKKGEQFLFSWHNFDGVSNENLLVSRSNVVLRSKWTFPIVLPPIQWC